MNIHRRKLQLVLGLNLISLGHLRSGFSALKESCRRSFHRSWSYIPEIPEISIGEILGSRSVRVDLKIAAYQDGSLPSEEAMALLAVAVDANPKEVLEIGTFCGHTTRQLAENLPGAIIHTLDLPESFAPENEPNKEMPIDDLHLVARRVVGCEFRDEPCAARIRQHFGDSSTWDFSQAGRPSLFFIDGAHTYEYCKNDSEKCFELCGGQGVFLWHDCDRNHPGVIKLVEEWRVLGRDVRKISGTPIAYWDGTR